jgi:hypothetical protein
VLFASALSKLKIIFLNPDNTETYPVTYTGLHTFHLKEQNLKVTTFLVFNASVFDLQEGVPGVEHGTNNGKDICARQGSFYSKIHLGVVEFQQMSFVEKVNKRVQKRGKM